MKSVILSIHHQNKFEQLKYLFLTLICGVALLSSFTAIAEEGVSSTSTSSSEETKTDTTTENDIDKPEAEQESTSDNLPGIKFVKVPEDERPKINIKFREGYKKTDLEHATKDIYQRTVVKQVKSGLTQDELRTTVELACSQYSPKRKKNYNIYLVDETSKRTIATYNCAGL